MAIRRVNTRGIGADVASAVALVGAAVFVAVAPGTPRFAWAWASLALLAGLAVHVARRASTRLPRALVRRGVRFADATEPQIASALPDEVARVVCHAALALARADRVEALGGRATRSLWVAGPPGSGRRTVAREVAVQAGAAWLRVPIARGPSPVDGTARLDALAACDLEGARALAQVAVRAQPCVVSLEVADGPRYPGGSPDAAARAFESPAVCTVFDALREAADSGARIVVVVVSSANAPPPEVRTRLDRAVTLRAPDVREREAVLRAHAAPLVRGGSLDLRRVAQRTAGLFPRGLAALVEDAVVLAAERRGVAVEQRDFDVALEARGRMRGAPCSPDSVAGAYGGVGGMAEVPLSDDERRRLAFRVAGGALAACTLEHLRNPRCVRLLAPDAWSTTPAASPSATDANLSRREVVDALTATMAALVAEELAFGGATVGFARATHRRARCLARHAVFLARTGERAARVRGDERRAELAALDHATRRATSLLESRRAELYELAARLVTGELVEAEVLESILRKRAPEASCNPEGALAKAKTPRLRLVHAAGREVPRVAPAAPRLERGDAVEDAQASTDGRGRSP